MPSEAAVIAALLLPKFTSEQCVHHDCCRFDDMPSHDESWFYLTGHFACILVRAGSICLSLSSCTGSMLGWVKDWTSWITPCVRTKPMTKLTPEMAADFLGCDPEGVAIRSMVVAHTSQVLYAICSEAINVVLPRILLYG